MADQTDITYMRRALELAVRGAGHVSPNPMVGAVIVKDGRIIGEGWHERIGGLHAERNAFKHCTEDCTGATIYVTLEPCCHWGRTPPCTDAIMEHKISRVVVGCLDPNPLVAGKGLRILRDAGIECVAGVLEDECLAVNEIFFHYITTKTPFVVMKYAMTLDGRIAAFTGDSKWITSETARKHAHETRKRLSAIMVGIGTVLADDPMLNCRIESGVDPLRLVCDSHLRTPLNSQLVRTAKDIPTWIFCADADVSRKTALEDAGVTVIPMPDETGTHVDLAAAMQYLGQQQVDSILLEGGGTLNGEALRLGLVHRVQAYIAPKLIGGSAAHGPVGGAGIARMADALQLDELTITRLGEDILIEGRIRKD
ncbi:MAG: bifunctional diaminohydroxyphosphoribosylaminopyrimidine deaminase/5-amino-6-(5-phosphoribosylamino)uracil reductase RibD [Eubacteriales bacterium]|nr:bifunctional diaminohydroxyphosphoribosylaminopyrimidine deaminase/5-amino-6-(5-phosphoribosylamino)uracil reductase RibD [Eubacteriales bacterium]